jgi:RNA polymerase sigma-70 factor (ECF subfamily)
MQVDANQTDQGARWMLAWQAGDEAAFDRIVECYAGRVYALLTRFLGRHPGREDLVQEVFLRVIRAAERYQPTALFSTWLYRIVYNLSINETQRAGARGQLSLDQGSADDDESPRIDVVDERLGTPTELLERGEAVLAVRAAIQALPEKQRMALVLAKYHELPYVEIAVVLDSSEKAIKSLVHRARETLREKLAPYLKGEFV